MSDQENLIVLDEDQSVENSNSSSSNNSSTSAERADAIPRRTTTTSIPDEINRLSPNPKNDYEMLLEQSALLIEDGILCRDINHKIRTPKEISLYRFYHSPAISWLRILSLTVLMSLAIFETPNSLTWSPDPRQIRKMGNGRPVIPVALTESIEIVLLLTIGLMALLETWLVGIKSLKRKPWIIFLWTAVLLSLVEIILDLARGAEEDTLLLRRLLRPFIFIEVFFFNL